MHPLKPFLFTLKLLLLLLSLSTQLLADANTQNLNGLNIEQVTLNHNNNNSFGSEYDDTLDASSLTIESEIIANRFRYLMNFGFNSPKDTYAIPDTGSDLIWLYGKTCESNQGGKSEDSKCTCPKYEKSKEACIEKPKKSVYCEDKKCNDLKEMGIRIAKCQLSKDLCEFNMSYTDGTKSEGIYGPANLWFTTFKSETKCDKPKTLNIGFSFPTSTKEEDDEEPKSQGIVGLGPGKLSLIKQYQQITLKFSYYLPQFRRKDEESIKARSKFIFGHGVKFSELLSTPLTEEGHSLCEIRYCVHLKSISVGEGKNNKIPVSDDTHQAHKVMIIDSGHTFTHLSKDIFDKFLGKVEEEYGKKGEKKGDDYHNCFEKDGNVEKLKKISFEFEDTKIELKRENFFDDYPYTEPNGEEKHYMCLTVQGENEKYHQRLRNYGKSSEEKESPHILGSRAQMDFLVAFNLIQKIKKVSFDDKSKHSEELSVLSE